MKKNHDFKAETDFRDLIRKPHKLFGYSFIYFVLVLGVIGFLYVGSLTEIGKNAISPLVLMDSTALVKDIPFQSARLLPPVDVTKIAVSTPELIAKGRDLFQANCSSCHGDAGEGNGPSAATMNPKPRNFHSLQGWTNGSKISQIYKTLEEGIVRNGMASYNYLPPADRFALIHYVRSLAAGQPVDSQVDIQGLETTYQLSKGSDIPGQIPIQKAGQILVAEEAPAVSIIEELAEKNHDTPGSPGGALFERLSRNKKKVLSVFILRRAQINSVEQFATIVSSDPIELGFKAEVARLSSGEWAALFQFLNGLKGKKG